MDNDFWNIIDVLMDREWQDDLQVAFAAEPEAFVENVSLELIVVGTPRLNLRSMNSASGPQNSNLIRFNSTRSCMSSALTRDNVQLKLSNAQFRELYFRERALRIKAEQRALNAQQRALIAKQRALIAKQKIQQLNNEIVTAHTIMQREYRKLQQYEALAKDMLLHNKLKSAGRLPAITQDENFVAMHFPRYSRLLESSNNAERFHCMPFKW